MKILIVASLNKGFYAPFIVEQAQALENNGHNILFFGIKGQGVFGYLKNRSRLIRVIQQFDPQIVHAHYGLSGLLANMQRKVPVVTTFHGSDINNKSVLRFSKLAMFFSAYTIFVSQRNIAIAAPKKHYQLLPCGIDSTNFQLFDKQEARAKLQLLPSRKYVLFAGSFSNRVKNPELAEKAIALLNNVELIELKGYSRVEVNYLMHAVDAALMTSHTEGSPQFIKEVMACGCPLVSVDVGDVKEITAGVDGCYLVSRDPKEIAEKLQLAIDFKERTQGRQRIMELGLSNELVAKKLIEIYVQISDSNR